MQYTEDWVKIQIKNSWENGVSLIVYHEQHGCNFRVLNFFCFPQMTMEEGGQGQRIGSIFHICKWEMYILIDGPFLSVMIKGKNEAMNIRGGRNTTSISEAIENSFE